MKKIKNFISDWQKKAYSDTATALNLKNPMAIPKLSKIVINIGLKEAVNNSKVIATATNVLSVITGQKPVKALAKKSIAGFKLREGLAIGVFVTLRKELMSVFLHKLINLALPKVRDFHGISSKFDGQGNFNLGLKDISVFPEAESVIGIDFFSGMNISIVTTTGKDEEGKVLLTYLGIPFVK